MRDATCVIEVGTHPAPYWIDANGGVAGPVCSRNREHLEERASWDDEFGPYDWRPFEPVRRDEFLYGIEREQLEAENNG